MTEINKYKQIIKLNPITAIEYSSCYNTKCYVQKKLFLFINVNYSNDIQCYSINVLP